MSTPAVHRMNAQEYLDLEAASQTKHEFFDGQAFAMAGASPYHVLICSNLIGHLYPQLQQSGCSVLGSDIRVKVRASGLYTYPDLAIVCGEMELEQAPVPSLLNPLVLVEVLSPSSEAYDRGTKFKHYAAIESLEAIVIISQDSFSVEYFAREDRDQWQVKIYSSSDQIVELPALQTAIPMSAVYSGVAIEPELRLRTAIDAPPSV